MLKYILLFTFFHPFTYLSGQENILARQEMERQSQMIKKLTGIEPIYEEKFLQDRSSFRRRRTTVQYISEYLRSIGYVSLHQDYSSSHPMIFPDFFFNPATGTNVYAILPASIPTDPYVVIGAHFDSERGSPGAGDNASGVALVCSLARILKQLDPLNLNYMFVLFDQEEDDEIGSRAFTELLQTKGIEIHSVHITDLAGWDRDGDGIITIQTSNPFLIRTYKKIAGDLNIEINITNGASSDNKSFLQSGYRTTGVFGDITKHLHKSTDTYNTVDPGYLGSMTMLLFEVLTHLNTTPE